MRREPLPPRVVALCLPELSLQRARRERERGDRERPIAVVSEGRVVHAEPAALADGVRPGATASAALAACGRLVTVPLDPAADRAALRALAEAVLLLAPAVEVAAPDVLLLDASGAHLVGGEDVLAARAIAAAAALGYASRAAIATGRASARALARHGPFRGAVLRVAPEDTARALAALPLEGLGLAPDVAARLRALGVTDAGALARLPQGTLAHRFGADGVTAARLARGEDAAPLTPFAPETLPEERLELEAPAESAEPLLFALKRLADRVAARLAGRGLGATRLQIVLQLDPRGEERIAVPLAQPSASAARWLLPAKEHLFSLRLPGAVTALKLSAVEVARVDPEQLAIGDRPERLAALEGVLARLAVRLGDGALFAAEPVERYRPEAAYRSVPFRPAQAGRTAGLLRAQVARVEADASATAEPAARPTRLLDAPARVVAEGEGGRLTALRVEGRARAVLAMEGPERLRGEWWSSPFDRDYYRIRLDGMGECWVFRDGADGHLYLHGFFD
jgi:protein ImuB